MALTTDHEDVLAPLVADRVVVQVMDVPGEALLAPFAYRLLFKEPLTGFLPVVLGQILNVLASLGGALELVET